MSVGLRTVYDEVTSYEHSTSTKVTYSAIRRYLIELIQSDLSAAVTETKIAVA